MIFHVLIKIPIGYDFCLSCVKVNEKLNALNSKLNKYFEFSSFLLWSLHYKTHLGLAVHRLLKEIDYSCNHASVPSLCYCMKILCLVKAFHLSEHVMMDDGESRMYD
jgi:hypothetical protein